MKPKNSGRKEILKIRVGKKNEIETSRESNQWETKSWFFEEITQIDQLLAKQAKIKTGLK